MKTGKRKDKKKSNTIDDFGITIDTLASRGEIPLFVRYLSGINLYCELEKRFGIFGKSAKVKDVTELFKQVICFLIDGTTRHFSGIILVLLRRKQELCPIGLRAPPP